MIGQNFTTTSDYTDESTVGPQGYPIQVVLSLDNPVLVQLAYKPFPYWNRVRWDFKDVELPAGQFRLGRCYGVRFKTANGTPATVFALCVYKEDPIVQSFSLD